MADNEHTLKIA